MPIFSNQVRAIQYNITVMVNNTLKERIALFDKEADSVAALANAVETPTNLVGALITMYVLNEIDESVVKTYSTAGGQITVSAESPNELIINVLVDIPAGKYKYYLDILFPNSDNYTYLVGSLFVNKP